MDGYHFTLSPAARMEDFASHVPAGPECATPRIRFLFIAPCFRVGLPPHPASRRRSCPSACLRLLLYLARGLAPHKLRAMPGTHARPLRLLTRVRAGEQYESRPLLGILLEFVEVCHSGTHHTYVHPVLLENLGRLAIDVQEGE